MKSINLIVFCLLMAMASEASEKPHIIPAPVSIELTADAFHISKNTSIHFNRSNKELVSLASFFNDYINRISGYKLTFNKKGTNAIRFEIINNPSLGSEGYLLDVNSNAIIISANNRKGLFYGMQTIFQTLTPVRTNAPLIVPGMTVVDYPRFKWRGMMLDVSRHFFPPETVKQYIDLLATYKMNVFHWHLVDDSGWRIEIKKYPKLTEIGAWRVDHTSKAWGDRQPAQTGEPATYGGFYTQEQIKEIVAYARQRNITIVPEIELPGHSVAALASYPQFSCSQKPQFVNTGGVYPKEIQSAYCPGNEEVFTFLQDILLEVMDLFPSEFIHIGGDEVDKSHWKKCSRCQQRMIAEGLKDVDELQSYMIRRMDKFLTSYNRRLIGWDEILEGGLASGATVMSWRGESGGIEAAKMGHDVVMTPGYPCYFDHYQAGPEGEPVAIGGMNTLKNVYDYEPIPKELTKEQAQFVLGAQANVWTEFIPTVEHLEYMILPRMLALSEVVWSPAEYRNWTDFNRRLHGWHFKAFNKKGLRYHPGNPKVVIKPVSKDGSLTVELKTEIIGADIYYTTDGSFPTLNSFKYFKPIEINETVILQASSAKDGHLLGIVPARQVFNIHKASGRAVNYQYAPSSYYMADGQNSLTDGVRGTLTVGKFWHGFNGRDMVAEIDLGNETEVTSLLLGALQKQVDWIFPPQLVRFSLSSDGANFTEVAVIKTPLVNGDNKAQTLDYKALIKPVTARYVKVVVENFGACPKGHPGEGQPTWLFVDEIVVE